MDNKDFFKIYIPALELALNNDSINYGYYVRGPEYYIKKKYQNQIDSFIENSTEFSIFFDMVGYYFDSISHNFHNIQGVKLNDYKKK